MKRIIREVKEWHNAQDIHTPGYERVAERVVVTRGPRTGKFYMYVDNDATTSVTEIPARTWKEAWQYVDEYLNS